MSQASGERGQEAGVRREDSDLRNQEAKMLTPDSRPLTPENRGVIAAIDYGDVRIGVALSDADRTTAEAEEELRGRGLTARQRKARRDMLAAQILLRDFLAGGCQANETPGGLSD